MVLDKKNDSDLLEGNIISSIRKSELSSFSRLINIGDLIDLVDGKKINSIHDEKLNSPKIKVLALLILEQIEKTLNQNPEEIRNKSIKKIALEIGDRLIGSNDCFNFGIGNYIQKVVYQVETIHLRYERLSKQKEVLALENDNSIDFLTGLINRKSMELFIKDYINEKKNHGTNHGIILIDIDLFKNINDNFGHLAGDIVLEEISKIFKKYFRETDKVARWGGEEFLIIMKGGNYNEYIKKAEELGDYISKNLLSITNTRILNEGKIGKINLDNITISSGITFLIENDSITSVIKRADEGLYSSKKSGRNKATFLGKNN